jgi:signal transduction histidine kinase
MGLIETYYQANVSDSESNRSLLIELLPRVEAQNRVNGLFDERLSPDELSDLNAEIPQSGDSRVPLESDSGLNVRRVASDSSKVVVSIPDFHFRIELPAQVAIMALPIISLLIGIVLSIWMSRGITRPLSNISAVAHAISKHNLSQRIETSGSKELQDLAQSINIMAENLEYAEVSRRNLMADIAHELRTPLSVLEGNLRAMLDGLHELNEEEIAILFEQTKHLNRLVDDLRELSLAEAAQLSLNFQEVDLNPLIKETVAHFEHAADEQGILLSTELIDPLIHSHLDENRIRQVLHNLISNALRHTPREGKVKVAAKRKSEDKIVEIAVIDTGVGISNEDIPYLFNRFQKTRTDLEKEGTGLGLAIVKAIIEMHGGTVSVESGGRDQGCIFTISLPES